VETSEATAAVEAPREVGGQEAYPIGSYEPRLGVGHLIGRLRTEMLAVLDRELAADEQLGALEVTAAQLIVIAKLAAEGERQCGSDLCKGISYDAGAMTRMVDRLESKGLIRRERCSDDRRLVYLALTESGRALYPRMCELSRQVMNRFLRGFEPQEVRELEGYVRRMLENA
jgi:DNA-binding MarR family transcriptional regulator